MPDHDRDKPLKRRGVSLVELAVGIAVAGVVGLVSASLFRAGLGSYSYAYRQTSVFTNARQAMAGSGSLTGAVWSAQSAQAVQSLSASTLSLLQPGGSTVTFQVSGGSFYQTLAGAQRLQAPSVSSAAFAYYNLDSAGLIMVSTSAAAATFVTVQLTLTGKSARDKTYNFLGGGQLRNRP